MKPASPAKDKLLPRFTRFFFDRPRITALLFLALTIFGVTSYTTLLKREGFPSVTIPVAIVTGTYGSTNPAEVEARVGKPLSEIAVKQPGVKAVETSSAANFVTVNVQYSENTDAQAATRALQQKVTEAGVVPRSARLAYNVPYFGATGGDIDKIDMALSFYDRSNQSTTAELVEQANRAARFLEDQNIANVERVFVKDPFKESTDPTTGKTAEVQSNFDQFGVRDGDQTHFYRSVTIALSAKKGFDVIKLDDSVRVALDKLRQDPQFSSYGTAVSASFAPQIKDNISELQHVLLEGLIVVLIVGSIIIAVRASLITVLSMLTVLAITTGFLYAIGYSLNVITLFALILGLSLIVDDTIIMVEAIDAARQRNKSPGKIISEASRKISRAMVAATATAALSFAPLLFVGGVLGSFIRAIPVTIISALAISLMVALVFIPFFARFILLGPKQLGETGVKEIAAGIESRIAHAITRPMLWARGSSRRLLSVGFIAVFIGTSFLAAGIYIAKDVVFNIFPPTKDTNGLVLNLQFKPGTTLPQAETIADKATRSASQEIGGNFVQSTYFSTGSPQSATQMIELTNYSTRDITSQQLVKQLQHTFDTSFKQAKVTVGQQDVGPPAASFDVEISADNRAAALKAASDMVVYLQRAELKRPNGTTARFTSPSLTSPDIRLRSDNKPVILVSAGFDGTDTSTLTTLAQTKIRDEFTTEKLQTYGLPADAVSFNLGQESENQESFKTLAVAFPAVLFVIYLLLALQFRSLLQPLLIFTAIPFSIFGIMLGLRLTHNPISFFSMLGFFALIGLSIKNTILLTDYANQSRRAGNGPVAAAAAALEERFRPLVATSLTAIASIIPLAITSPFWQGLAVVLIFGLLSSTILVILVFPYYYLAAEFLRIHIRRSSFFLWVLYVAAIAAIVVNTKSLSGAAAALVVLYAAIAGIVVWAFSKWTFRRRA